MPDNVQFVSVDALLRRRARLLAIQRALPERLAELQRRIAQLAGIDPSLYLSHRESEVIKLVREGLTNKEIGARLFISERAIKFHVTNLLEKFGRAKGVKCTSRKDLMI